MHSDSSCKLQRHVLHGLHYVEKQNQKGSLSNVIEMSEPPSKRAKKLETCFDATGSCLFCFFHFWNSYYSGAGTQEWLFVESGAPKWESTSLRLAGMDERVATPTPKFATPSPALLRPEPYIKIRWALSEGCTGGKSDRKKKRRREFKQCHFELSSSGGSPPISPLARGALVYNANGVITCRGWLNLTRGPDTPPFLAAGSDVVVWLVIVSPPPTMMMTLMKSRIRSGRKMTSNKQVYK